MHARPLLTASLLPIVLALVACDDPPQTPPAPEPTATAAPATTTVSPAAATASATSSPATGNEPWHAPEPNPEDRPAYYAHLMKVIPGALEKTTCACCQKSLMQCYRDMGDEGAAHRCPYG